MFVFLSVIWHGECNNVDQDAETKLNLKLNFLNYTFQEAYFQVNSNGLFEVELELAPGIYEYKFLLNGVWSLDPTKPTIKNVIGGENNILIVS